MNLTRQWGTQGYCFCGPQTAGPQSVESIEPASLALATLDQAGLGIFVNPIHMYMYICTYIYIYVHVLLGFIQICTHLEGNLCLLTCVFYVVSYLFICLTSSGLIFLF